MDDGDPGEGTGENGDDGPADSPSPFDPGDPLADHWAALLEDAAATADVYREEGWSALELHPTEAGALTDPGDAGLEVTVPGEEFDRLESWVAEGTFGEYEVYRAETGRVFLLVVARDEGRRRLVCVPAHYGFESVSALADRAGSGEPFHTHVRSPGDGRLTFAHDDPAPFFPGGGGDSEGGTDGDGDARDPDGR